MEFAHAITQAQHVLDEELNAAHEALAKIAAELNTLGLELRQVQSELALRE